MTSVVIEFSKVESLQQSWLFPPASCDLELERG